MKPHIQALVLCAGRGTRLGDLTAKTPKPMLPIAGRPALEWTLEWLADYGYHHVAVNLGEHGDVITNHFGPRLHYSWEPKLLGTGGALMPIAGLTTSPFLVVFGDVLTRFGLDELAEVHKYEDITLAVQDVADPSGKGIVSLYSTPEYLMVSALAEKPADPESNTVFAGVALISDRVVQDARSGDDFIGDTVQRQHARHWPIRAYRVWEYLLDFGTLETYKQACREWPGTIGAEA